MAHGFYLRYWPIRGSLATSELFEQCEKISETVLQFDWVTLLALGYVVTRCWKNAANCSELSDCIKGNLARIQKKGLPSFGGNTAACSDYFLVSHISTITIAGPSCCTKWPYTCLSKVAPRNADSMATKSDCTVK